MFTMQTVSDVTCVVHNVNKYVLGNEPQEGLLTVRATTAAITGGVLVTEDGTKGQ